MLDLDREERSGELDVGPLRQRSVVPVVLEHRAEERVERVHHQHPRIAIRGGAQVTNADAVAVPLGGQDELDEALVLVDVDRDRLAWLRRIALRDQAREHVPDRRVTPLWLVVGLHALLFAFLPAIAQAQTSLDRGISPFAAAAIARHIESRSGGSFLSVGTRATVDAGILIAEGTIFRYEVGLRAGTTVPSSDYDGVYVGRSIGAFGGVRIQIARRAMIGQLRPVLRGGIGVYRVTDRFQPPARTVVIALDRLETRWTAGPHMAVGLEWDLGGGAALNVSGTAHATIAPLVLDLGAEVSLVGAVF